MTRIPPSPDSPANDNPDALKPPLRRRQERIRAEASNRHPEAAGELGGLFDEFRRRMGVAADAHPGQVVAGYWPVRTEISPLELMEELAGGGMSTALPAIPRPGGTLSFHAWEKGGELVDGHHGVPGPNPGNPEVAPDIVLVPLLAFDHGCHRLGYGGGYYDRTLAALRSGNPHVMALGLAYGEQRVDQLPVEDHDAPLDAVLTPKALFWPGEAASPAGLA